MTIPTNMYPDWQQLIREAQAKSEARDEEMRRKEAVEKAEKDRKMGEGLGKALAYFGIKAAPETNHFEIDGYHFYLDMNGYSSYVGQAGHTIVTFSLNIRKPIPGATPDDYKTTCNDWIQINSHRADGDWSSFHTRMAYAMDGIDREIANFADQYEERKARTYALPIAATTEERLMSAIRDLIREVTHVEEY